MERSPEVQADDPWAHGSWSAENHPAKLNLGCGFDHRSGYLNVDFQAAHQPDLLSDVRTLPQLDGDRYEEIIAQDVLEHLHRADTIDALRRWNDLLALGGRLVVRTTDVIGLAAMLSHHRDPENQAILLQNLFGTQAYDGDYHLAGFTEVSLRSALHETGFEVSTIERFDNWLLDCTAVKTDRSGPLDLGPLPLMDLPNIVGAAAPTAPEAGAIDRSVAAIGRRLPPSVAGLGRRAWRTVRARAVRGRRRLLGD